MLKSKPELVISLIALTLSVIATIASIYFSNIGMKTNVLPTLIFVYESEKGWTINNVGNGPALNVVVAHQDHGDESWKDPTRLYPISEGGIVGIEWIGQNPNKLISTYTDVHNRSYTSLTDEDLTTIKDKKLQHIWNETDIKKIWERR